MILQQQCYYRYLVLNSVMDVIVINSWAGKNSRIRFVKYYSAGDGFLCMRELENPEIRRPDKCLVMLYRNSWSGGHGVAGQRMLRWNSNLVRHFCTLW